VERVKYLRVVSTSDERQNKKTDTQIGEENAVKRELHRFLVAKPELSKTGRLPVFQSVFVPILTYGHKF